MKCKSPQQPVVETVSVLPDGKTLLIVTNDKRLIHRIEAARKKYPDDVKVCDALGGCPAYQLPLRWLDITPPLRLSDAERKRRGERLSAAQKSKKRVL